MRVFLAFWLREAIEDYVRTAIRQNRNGKQDICNNNGFVHDELLPRPRSRPSRLS